MLICRCFKVERVERKLCPHPAISQHNFFCNNFKALKSHFISGGFNSLMDFNAFVMKSQWEMLITFLMQCIFFILKTKDMFTACENWSTSVDGPHKLFPWAKFILSHKGREIGWVVLFMAKVLIKIMSFPSLTHIREESIFWC